jgi:nitroreductase
MNSIALIPKVIEGERATGGTSRYDALMATLRSRVTAREFDRGYTMPKAHIEMVVEAASLAPSGANTQPWHFIVVRNQRTKRLIADQMVADHARRGSATGRLHKVDYSSMGHAPGFIVVLTDPRMTWAYPGMMDGTELDQAYHAHGERVLLQSVAAATMAATLAATALGYETWWVSALGQEEARAAIAEELGIPPDLHITDFFLFGPALLPPARRWKRDASQIMSWDKFDRGNFKSVEEIDNWMEDAKRQLAEERAKPSGLLGGPG